MRFLVDAQLPARLADLLNRAGHEAIHSSDLDDGNRTTDQEICRRADLEHRTVITKDRDFRDTHLLSGTPRSVTSAVIAQLTSVTAPAGIGMRRVRPTTTARRAWGKSVRKSRHKVSGIAGSLVLTSPKNPKGPPS
ncbi:hypothetical protein GPOL_c14660 [Gordonia polyisoprenivorans VH2]|uniref:DUF5615 domain-containing protein n=1 Tax=Gordonia polyisoprenivorans (strain DSM 44266 / VH2) TaxID=1112204 RepID=H6MRQ0_GORPV|nr:DUF5615 family PIN-like protein [Gordonia polyisoprenivorans]AFA72516.1 hypothetical protein GPOL_c14660 [Gordonia polyisoprenivorans VH2]